MFLKGSRRYYLLKFLWFRNSCEIKLCTNLKKSKEDYTYSNKFLCLNLCFFVCAIMTWPTDDLIVFLMCGCDVQTPYRSAVPTFWRIINIKRMCCLKNWYENMWIYFSYLSHFSIVHKAFPSALHPRSTLFYKTSTNFTCWHSIAYHCILLYAIHGKKCVTNTPWLYHQTTLKLNIF